MLNKYAEAMKNRLIDQENDKYRDIYTECEKRGCPITFARAFNTRAEMFPMKQTLSFIELKDDDNLVLWRTYLEVLQELRYTHPKIEEWGESLMIINGYLQ